MTPTITITLPAAVREDFVETYGWDRLVAEMGGERKGMKDAWTAIEFSAPKGSGAHYTVRFHKVLLPILKLMLELRWSDHFSCQGELSAPYDRVIDQLIKIQRKR